jgi:glycosyltransferase involved in cell wall biosynthesis
MRIGVIAPEFPPNLGGMERLAYGLANALGATDDVVVFTPTGNAVSVAGAFDEQRVLSGTLGRDLDRLRKESVDVWLALNGGLIPLLALLASPRFVYLHGNDFLAPWLGYGSPWLEPIRAPFMEGLRQAARKKALRRSAERVSHYFTNSRQTAGLACSQLGLDAHRVSVCPPGVDESFFQESLAHGPRPLHLLTVTRLTEHSRRKNVDGVLRGLASLRGEIEFSYSVVGDGPDRERLADLSAELGIGESVHFLGALDDRSLREAYADADVFILASKATGTDVEGFGIAYVEANAAGVPTIASRAGGAIDAVVDGISGILLDDSSPAAIATGIRRFVSERARFSDRAIRDWARRHRWPDIARRMRDEMAAHVTQAVGDEAKA